MLLRKRKRPICVLSEISEISEFSEIHISEIQKLHWDNPRGGSLIIIFFLEEGTF